MPTPSKKPAGAKKPADGAGPSGVVRRKRTGYESPAASSKPVASSPPSTRRRRLQKLADLKGKGKVVELQDTTQKKLRFEQPKPADRESSATISADSGPVDLASPVSPGELEAKRLAAEAPLYTE